MSIKNGPKPLSIVCKSKLTLYPDAFPSSEAFDAINAALSASDAERADAIKQGNAVFAFTIKNKAGETESWHIDLKDKGVAGKGLGTKPTGMLRGPSSTTLPFRCITRSSCQPCWNKQLTSGSLVTISISDDDFGKLVTGKANAQRLFMSGKLKAKGDVMKATKMEPILKKAQPPKAKL